MAKQDTVLSLMREGMASLTRRFPPVCLMINFDVLNDAYVIRASAFGLNSVQWIYWHEIETKKFSDVAYLFIERAMNAITVVRPNHNPMQGASEYDDIMQAQTIMDELKP